MRQQGCAGSGLWLSRQHPKLARTARGPEAQICEAKRRGLEVAPKLAVGDGAMGFRAALHEVYGMTRVQRCWVHKTANLLNAMPKSVQPKAKAHLKELEDQETIRGIVCPNNGWPRPRTGPMLPSISSSRPTV